eukprot:763867-Hanusia_phi.AAC.5
MSLSPKVTTRGGVGWGGNGEQDWWIQRCRVIRPGGVVRVVNPFFLVVRSDGSRRCDEDESMGRRRRSRTVDGERSEVRTERSRGRRVGAESPSIAVKVQSVRLNCPRNSPMR